MDRRFTAHQDVKDQFPVYGSSTLELVHFGNGIIPTIPIHFSYRKPFIMEFIFDFNLSCIQITFRYIL